MTAPEWRAPPDTMTEELPQGRPYARMPRADDDRERVGAWAQAVLGVRCEFVSRHGGYDATIILAEGSEWSCAVLRSVATGYRVVRVVPMPRIP